MVRTFLAALLLLGGWAAIPADAGAAPTVIVSDEVAAPNTSCTDPNATIRANAELLDDAWRSSVTSGGYSVVSVGTVPAPEGNVDQPTNVPGIVTFPGSSVTVAVSKKDITPADRDSNADASWGFDDTGTYRDPYYPVSASLQDCAPRPTSLYNSAAQPNYWNATGGDGSNLDAAFFAFSEPVAAFGAWFGDVETRTDGNGVTAYVKLFDAAGRVLSIQPIPTSTPDQSLCGGNQPTDYIGCGNQATRWIGFQSATAEVAYMLVVVGEDDACSLYPDDCNGNTEHLSWIGPTLAERPATLSVTKTTADASYDVGDLIDYTITVTNSGDRPTTASIVDTLPPGTSLVSADLAGYTYDAELGTVSWSDVVMDARGTLTIQVQLQLDAISSDDQLVNDVSVSWDQQQTSNSVPVGVNVADIAVQKTGVVSEDGTSITWTIQVENLGPDAAKNVVLEDVVDASQTLTSLTTLDAAWTCSLAGCNTDLLPVGVPVLFTATADIVANSDVYANDAAIQTSTQELTTTNNTTQATVTTTSTSTSTSSTSTSSSSTSTSSSSTSTTTPNSSSSSTSTPSSSSTSSSTSTTRPNGSSTTSSTSTTLPTGSSTTQPGSTTSSTNSPSTSSSTAASTTSTVANTVTTSSQPSGTPGSPTTSTTPSRATVEGSTVTRPVQSAAPINSTILLGQAPVQVTTSGPESVTVRAGGTLGAAPSAVATPSTPLGRALARTGADRGTLATLIGLGGACLALGSVINVFGNKNARKQS
ncbi:MAG: DUF11 domain-containing protein [Acidimicrobiia bacterium]|nr:DUF11 domain-containing protein [Acidimicrobiia bacterium]